MKIITNRSLQSWSLPLRTEKGVEDVYLSPRQSIKVPDTYITDHVIRFQERRLITIQNAK